MLFFWTNGATSLAPPASRESPTISRPLSLYLSCIFTKCGISTRQGPHHVAQKSTITTLPLKSESLTFFPERSASSNSGAAEPMLPASAAGLGASASGLAPVVPSVFSCRAQPTARTTARMGMRYLEDRIVFLQFVVGDPRAVRVPLDALVLDELREHVLAQSLAHELRFLGQLDGLDQASRQAADVQLIPLLLVHLVAVSYTHLTLPT